MFSDLVITNFNWLSANWITGVQSSSKLHDLTLGVPQRRHLNTADRRGRLACCDSVSVISLQWSTIHKRGALDGKAYCAVEDP